ncbi:dehydrogenase [Desulfotomaculum copahuensis]|uniref:Dehydrogenase n=1 Tax=Desulfotomaculum copahuensis TaxID=1838280 RepID=A0A1B7LGE2_9FIRM|nr:dehydrogenase [Desulfotomaculum copahuensis]
MEWRPTICGICPGACGVLAGVKGGRLAAVKPLPGHPRGMLCVRGKHAPEIVHSPDRLQHPLRRQGERGNFNFVPAGWDTALAEIAGRLLEIKDRWGPQALMCYTGRGGFEQCLGEFFAARTDTVSNGIFFPLGSPNAAGAGSVCAVSYGLLASVPTFGTAMRLIEPDVENSRLIVVWGANPATDSPPEMLPRIRRAKRRGAGVIVIDQMRSEMAREADQWVPVRPGTDGALALGLINVIIREGLYDREFVENWTQGFPELAEYVRRFTPDEVARITGVPGQTMVALARELATGGPASLHMFTGLEYSSSGVQNIRAVFILWAITGNLDVPGGMLFNPVPRRTGRIPDLRPPEGVPPVGADRHPLFHRLTRSAHFMEMPRAVLKDDPYPVRALILDGASIITGYPQPDLWRRVFAKLELLVVIDRFMTADAAYAHYVLPATTYYENYSLQRYRGYIQLRTPVVEPVGESRNDFFIFAALAKQLGYGHLFPQTPEELWQWAFAKEPALLEELKQNPQGLPLPEPPQQYRKYAAGKLRPDGRPGFNTPSGKVEIASSLLARYGYDALPVYTEPAESPLSKPALLAQYPLVLNTGTRIHSTFRSQHLNIPGLVRLQPRARVLINPDDAAARGIADGQKVQVITPRGRVTFMAQVTENVPPGTVEANMGGGGPGQAAGWREANVNYLTDPDYRDPVSGFPVFKAMLCRVEPV